MKSELLFDDGQHRWIALGRDPARRDQVIDTNEYLIVSHGEGLLLDPGGTEIFPQVLAAVTEHIDARQIKTFFASHQDPDVMSSLPLWMMLCQDAEIHLPRIWGGFMAHFGYEYIEKFHLIQDQGGPFRIGARGRMMEFVPAHYCHSSGNFSMYDPHAKILFSGDIGAALVPDDAYSLFVEDFDRHIQYMEGFHRRWMPSNRAKNAWVQRVRALEVDMLCPQHGSIFRGPDVKRFLDWLEALEVGMAIA